MPVRLAIAAAALAVVAAGSLAQPTDVTVKPYETGANFTQEDFRLVDRPDLIVAKLQNGLTVIAKEVRSMPVVHAKVLIGTGGIHEHDYLGMGLSHLVEHLVAGGTTTKRSEAEIDALIDSLGGDSNAYVTTDHTAYFINTTSDPANRKLAIELLADMVTYPTFPLDEFEREFGVVQRELDQGADEPGRQMWYTQAQNLFGDHPAGYPVIGFKQALQRATHDIVKDYFNKRYTPDNMVVVVAGDFEAEDALDDVQQSFRELRRREAKPVILPEVQPVRSPRQLTKRLSNLQTAMFSVAWPSIPLDHPDLYALDVLSHILTNGQSSRLHQALVKDEQLMFNVSGYSWTPDWGAGAFVVTGRSEPGKVAAAIEAIQTQIARVKEAGVSADELKKAKRQKTVEYVAGKQTAESIGSDLARSYMMTGDVFFNSIYTDRIQNVTADDIRRVAKAYLVPEHRVTTLLLPEGAEAPQLDSQPPAELDSWKKKTLDNGVTVLVRRNTQVPLVVTRLAFPGGLLTETAETNGVSNAMAAMLTKGTASRSADDIANYFDSVGGSLSASSGSNTVIVSMSTYKDDFTDGWNVMADVLKNASFPADEWAILQPQLLSAIRSQDEEPTSEVFRLLRARHWLGTPYAMSPLGTAETVGAMTPDALAKAHQEMLTRTPVLSVVGDVDPERVFELAQETLGGLKDLTPMSALKATLADAVDAERAPGVYVLPSDKGVAAIGVGYPAPAISQDRVHAIMNVLDTVISGYRYPGGWLHNSLRGLGGRNLVYVVHSIHQPMVADGGFITYALCAPGSASEVLQIIRARLDAAKYGDVSSENFAINQQEIDREIASLRKALGDGIANDVATIKKTTLSDAMKVLPDEDKYLAKIDAMRAPLIDALKRSDKLSDAQAVAEADRLVALAKQTRYGFISPQEIEAAKKLIITAEQLTGQSLADAAQQAALDELYGLGYDWDDGLPQRIRSVSRDELIDAARQWLQQPVIIVTTPNPDALEIPDGWQRLNPDGSINVDGDETAKSK